MVRVILETPPIGSPKSHVERECEPFVRYVNE